MIIDEYGVTIFEPGPEPDPQQVKLGQALFFDKILSGERDIACATCHHPTLAGGDRIPLPIGTGGSGLGENRKLGDSRNFIPRNSPEIFNRGSQLWMSMFWDSRVAIDNQGELTTPAGNLVPEGLDSVLAAQAMFPVTSVDEMRGFPSAPGYIGPENELAHMHKEDLEAIWDGLMARLLSYPEYVEMFHSAYLEVPVDELGFQHAANAIAAFEVEAFSLNDSPWDRYLTGDDAALTRDAKQGARQFYGQARCAECHAGPLFTDQKHHVLAAPQIGPGKGSAAPLDTGRMEVTGEEGDQFAFRTPSLRNVAQTGPWMHDGAYSTLEAVISHHLDPAVALGLYGPQDHLPPELLDAFLDDRATRQQMLANLDPLLSEIEPLSDEQISQLIAFMESLTDPAINKLEHIVPDVVPSGLPVID